MFIGEWHNRRVASQRAGDIHSAALLAYCVRATASRSAGQGAILRAIRAVSSASRARLLAR